MPPVQTVSELRRALASLPPDGRVHIDAPTGGDAQITVLDQHYRLLDAVVLKRDPYA